MPLFESPGPTDGAAIAMRRCAPAATAAILLLGWVMAQAAQEAEGRRPLRIQGVQPLQFGRITTEGRQGGTVTVSPRNSAKIVSGGVIDLGGFHAPAEFRVYGEPHARFLITLPHRVVLSEGGQDGSGAIIENFVSDPTEAGLLNAQGEATIRVGATLRVAPGVDAAQYKNSFDVYVDYEE